MAPSAPPRSHVLRLRLLGPVEFTQPDGTPLGAILAQPKRLALLAFLALSNGGGFQRRDVLLNLFWPEFEQERARAALRRALYFLRKSLGDGVIIPRGDEEVALAPERIWCDVVALRAAVDAGQLEEALELYGGDLLPGFFIPDASDFERWLEAERRQLRLLAARTAATLSERAEAAGDLEEAARRAHVVLALDAQSEPVFRRLVGLLHRRGDRAGIARAYELWRRRLDEEYSIEPSAETQRTIATLMADGGDAVEASRTPSAALSPAVARPDTQGPLSPAIATAPPVARATWRSRRGPAWAAALIALAALLAAALFVNGGSELRRDRVLVTVFENHTGLPALDPVGRMAADWIARGLMLTGNVEVISATSALLAVTDDESPDVRAMARQAGTGTVVSGAYYLESGVLRMQAHITDAARGRLLHTLDPIRVPPDSATAGAELLRQRISGALAARFDWSAEWTELTRRVQPPTYAAYAEFVEGRDLFSGSMFQVNQIALAAERFERAWALDTTFYIARLYASLMYHNLGDARRDSVLQSVAFHREELAPGERALLEHFRAVQAGDNVAALRTARQVNETAPNSLLAGYAYWAVANNRPREALKVHSQLDTERGLLNGTEYYWRWLTIARHMLGDYRRELRDARQGRLREPQLMGPLFQEARALAALGRTDDVDRVLEESHSLPKQSFTPAAVMLHTAAELRAHGHAEAAARVLERAIAWYDTRTDEERRAQRETLARTFYAAGRWEEARVLFEELAAEQPARVQYIGYLGTLAARRGDRAEAERVLAVLASFRQPTQPVQTLWRAKIATLLGDSGQALDLLREAFAEGLRYDLSLHVDPDLESLRRHPTFRALLRPKG